MYALLRSGEREHVGTGVHTTKDGPSCKEPSSCVGLQYSVTMIALLDDYGAMAMVAVPATMPATIVVNLGARAVPAVMMTTALDDDGLGTCDRRNGHRHRADCRQNKSKPLHGVLLHCEMRTADAEKRSGKTARSFLNACSDRSYQRGFGI